MRELANSLPLNEAGLPTLRDAFRSIAQQLSAVRGKGPEAAEALVKSAPYQQSAAVLTQWYGAECPRDKADPPPKD